MRIEVELVGFVWIEVALLGLVWIVVELVGLTWIVVELRGLGLEDLGVALRRSSRIYACRGERRLLYAPQRRSFSCPGMDQIWGMHLPSDFAIESP